MNPNHSNTQEASKSPDSATNVPDAAETECTSLTSELKWYQNSFIFVLLAALFLAKAPLISFVLFMIGLLNTERDKWFKNRFLVFLVSMVALFGMLQWLYISVIS